MLDQKDTIPRPVYEDDERKDVLAKMASPVPSPTVCVYTPSPTVGPRDTKGERAIRKVIN